MSIRIKHGVSSRIALAIAAALALAACDRGAVQEVQSPAPAGATEQARIERAKIDWARDALARNPHLEVIATDPLSGVLTVKDRRTGELQAVKLSEIAAAPVSQLKPMESQPAPPPIADPAPSQQESATAPAGQSAATPNPGQQAQTPSANASQASGNYTIERTDGQVRVSGPGVSIVSSGTVAASGEGEGRQRTVDPFICEGRRMLQLDNRDIYVDGDAITARGGCELYITNSRIVASGTGIVVRDATVHVSNSHIEGANGSFEADDRARMFVRGSTFQGVPRRAQMAQVQDQGGNRWR